MKKILLLIIAFYNFGYAVDQQSTEAEQNEKNFQQIMVTAVNKQIENESALDCEKLKQTMTENPLLWSMASFQLNLRTIQARFIKLSTLCSEMHEKATLPAMVNFYKITGDLELQNTPLYIRLQKQNLSDMELASLEIAANHPYLQDNCTDTIQVPGTQQVIKISSLPKKSERITNYEFYNYLPQLASHFIDIGQNLCNHTLGINPGIFLATGISEEERNKLTKPGIFLNNFSLDTLKQTRQLLEVYYIQYQELMSNLWKKFDPIYAWTLRVSEDERIILAGNNMETAATQLNFVNKFIHFLSHQHTEESNTITSILEVDSNFINFEKQMEAIEGSYNEIQDTYTKVLQDATNQGLFEGANKSDFLSKQFGSLKSNKALQYFLDNKLQSK